MTARVETDLTSVYRGLVRARWARSSSPLFPGDAVIVVDPDEQLAAEAVVVQMVGQFAYLDVDWSSQRDDHGTEDWVLPAGQMLPNDRYLTFGSRARADIRRPAPA